MSDLLFETPWWLPTSIILLGLTLFLLGNMRQQFRVRTAGLVLMLLALALITVSALVETDKEKCVRQTRELVGAVQDGKWPTFTALLDPRVTLDVETGSVYADRDALTKGAQDATTRYGLKTVHITSLLARQNQSVVTCELTAFSVQDATMGRPLPSSWELEWQKRDDGWKLAHLTCIRVGDMNVNQTKSMFP